MAILKGSTRGFWILAAGLAVNVPAMAQTAAWPIATLHAPTAIGEVSAVVATALAGDSAVVVHAPTASQGSRVFVRDFVAGEWSPARLIGQGQLGDGAGVSLAADADSIAVGLPNAPGGGRVDIYRRSGADWSLAQSIPAISGLSAFGIFVSVRQSLLVISSSNVSGRFDVYRRSPSGLFEEAGYTGTNPLMPSHYGRTDGTRVSVCANTNCWTRSANAQGLWVTDATFGPGAQATTNGDQLVMRNSQGIGVYAAGSSQMLLQQLAEAGDFAVRDGRLVVRATSPSSLVRIYERDVAGVWSVAAEFSLPDSDAANLAIDADRALVGIQSFSRSASSWMPARTVEAIVDPATIGFAAAVSLAGGRAWAGSPDFNGDLKSGAAWSGTVSTAPSIAATRHLPEGPAMYAGFGSTMRSDGTRVAVGSLPRYSVDRRIRISVFDSATGNRIGDEILAPDSAVQISSVHAGVDGDTLAVARTFTATGPDVLVYRNSGSRYLLVQTLTLPSPSGGNGHGRSVVVAGDWLQASRRSYRKGGDGLYVDAGELAVPAGMTLDFGQLSQSGSRLLVPVVHDPDGSRVAMIYTLDAASGWTLTGNVFRNGAPIAACHAVALGSNVAACMGVSSGDVFVATSDGFGPDWRITGSGSVPGSTGTAGPDRLAIDGNRLIVAVPGAAVVMSLSEAIFSSGFQAN